MQFASAEAPGSETVFSGQATHVSADTAPDCRAYFPAGHNSQAPEPGRTLNLPGGQALQKSELTFDEET